MAGLGPSGSGACGCCDGVTTHLKKPIYPPTRKATLGAPRVSGNLTICIEDVLEEGG